MTRCKAVAAFAKATSHESAAQAMKPKQFRKGVADDINIRVPIQSEEIMEEIRRELSTSRARQSGKSIATRALVWEMTKRGIKMFIPFDNDPKRKET